MFCIENLQIKNDYIKVLSSGNAEVLGVLRLQLRQTGWAPTPPTLQHRAPTLTAAPSLTRDRSRFDHETLGGRLHREAEARPVYSPVLHP